MKKILIQIICASLFSFSANAEKLECKITYDIKGWSVFYKQYKGAGLVSCNNGQHASVSIISRGGGLTFGKSDVNKGSGAFSSLLDISEIYGTYIALDAHAGAVVSVDAQVMTKGEVSLAISGNGRGVDLGIALSGFSIKPR